MPLIQVGNVKVLSAITLCYIVLYCLKILPTTKHQHDNQPVTLEHSMADGASFSNYNKSNGKNCSAKCLLSHHSSQYEC